MGYLFTSDCLDRQVDHRINRLIGVAVNFRGGEGWVSACHHCRVVPSDEDAQSLAKVTHHLVLVLAKFLLLRTQHMLIGHLFWFYGSPEIET